MSIAKRCVSSVFESNRELVSFLSLEMAAALYITKHIYVLNFFIEKL